MIISNTKSKSPTKLVSLVSIVIGLAIMGDSLMYSLLPLEAESLGIPIAYVGLLLSINRIVRLGTNTWAGIIYEKHQAKFPFVFACLIALISTTIYGAGLGFVAFLIARAGWGMAWSLFRQGGYFSIWTADGKSRGRLTGLLWGIVRLGSAISVFLGGMIYDKFGFSTAVFLIAAFAILAIPIALRLPWPSYEATNSDGVITTEKSSWKRVIQNKNQRWLLTVGFGSAFFDSIIVSTASLFLISNLGDTFGFLGLSIGTTAGLLLGLRFSANILFGPIIGAISDKLGQAKTLSWLSIFILAGLCGAIYLESIWVSLSIALIFISTSGLYVTGNATASKEGENSTRPHLFIGFFNTAIDSGSAVGPLVVYSSALLLNSLEIIYFVTGIILFVVIQKYYRNSASQIL